MARNKAGSSPTAFRKSLQADMDAWCIQTRNRPLAWATWLYGIYPDYRKLAEATVRTDSVKLHEYSAHLLSSQAFAFNLFLPFREGNRERLSERISALVGAKLTIDRVRFEWVPPGGLLGEIEGEWPVGKEPATGVDVVLWGWLENGRRCVVLVEVKLSEGGFTPCKGRTSPNNHRKDVCRSARLLLENPNDCYLRRPDYQHRDRRYWEIFAKSDGSVRNAFPHIDLNGECPFAYHMQQPMRNLAIARALEQEDTVQKAWYVLCAHDDNPDVAKHWKAWQSLLPDRAMAPVLHASEVVAAGEADGLLGWADYMRKRYRLKEVTS